MPESFCQAMRWVALGRLLLESKCAVRSSARVAVLFGCRYGAPNSCALHSVRNGQEGIAHACARSSTRSDGVDSSTLQSDGERAHADDHELASVPKLLQRPPQSAPARQHQSASQSNADAESRCLVCKAASSVPSTAG